MHYKGYILEMSEGGKRAKIEALGGRIFENLLVFYPYGEASNIQPDDTSLCTIFLPMNDESNAFCVPYNVPLQPSLEPSEKAVGNFKKGNKVTFKANGDIELTGAKDFLAKSLSNLEITATTEIKIIADEVKLEGISEIKADAPEVKLGDATALILSTLATITDSVGGACTIVSAGQTKVKA
tara:strand:+ start:38 stop:583 length:546 start_codon:yes stop_codon:yes gene_type:complete